MPRRYLTLTGLLTIVSSLSACNIGSYACTDSVEPGIVLEIRDSVSGAGLAAHALATVVDGGFTDSLRFVSDPDSAYQYGLDERAGTYNLTVSAAGYQQWTLNSITVPDGACHVQTVRLLARLTS